LDFARPLLLLLLTLLPLAMALGALTRKRRTADWVALGRSGHPPAARAGRWVAAMGLLILGLAGPRIGRLPGSERPKGHDLVLLMDASRSMAAEDVFPNRMGAAMSAAEGLVRELAREPGERVAVVAFAGGVEPLCPLTDRLDAAVERLRALQPGSVRPGGTELGGAIVAALEAFDEQESSDGRAIVVFSDGEDLSGSWPDMLQKLTAAHVIVHAVTFGDSERGHVIPGGPRGASLLYHGEPVLTRRSDDALSAICKATGGMLVPAGLHQADLASLYRDKIAPSERAHRSVTSPPERADRASWCIAAALGLIGSWVWPKSRRIGALAVLFAICIGAGPSVGSVGDAIRAGDSAYRAADFAKAVGLFEEAIRLDPESAIPRYNAAATHFQLGHFDQSERLYLEARERADGALRTKIDYAVGNVAVAQGRFQESVAHYDACLASPADGPAVAAVKSDARANRLYAKRRVPPPSTPDSEGGRHAPDEKPKPEKPSANPPPRNEGDEQTAPPSAPPDGPPGGAGAGRPDPTGGRSKRPAGSPEDRLEAMLDEVRRGQTANRDGEDKSPPKSETDRKDW
jgi:Ca-activated chloride channel homolog